MSETISSLETSSGSCNMYSAATQVSEPPERNASQMVTGSLHTISAQARQDVSPPPATNGGTTATLSMPSSRNNAYRVQVQGSAAVNLPVDGM